MKPIELILSLIIIVLVTFMTLNFIEDRKEDSLKQSTINGLRLQNKKERDSLENVIKFKDDSLRIAKHTIILQADTIKNQELDKENYKRNRHDKIVFVVHSDSSRTESLKQLYVTFKP